MSSYMADITGSDFDKAWSLLSPATQRGYASVADFTSERTAFMQSAGGDYTLGPLSQDPALFAQWLPPNDPLNPPLARAYIAEVDYPRLANNPAGFDILIAAPDAQGRWLIWSAR
jgi:hypothetical protein